MKEAIFYTGAALLALGAVALISMAAARRTYRAPRLSFEHHGFRVYDVPGWFTASHLRGIIEAVVEAWPHSPWTQWTSGNVLTFVAGGALYGETVGSASTIYGADKADRASALTTIRHELCHQALIPLGILGEDAHAEIRRVFGASA